MITRLFLCILIIAGRAEGFCQFAPAAGEPGTTALYKDSSAFTAWATAFSLEQGPQELGATDSPLASAGLAEYCLGKAGENPSVSLGDGGFAILQFPFTIRNGEGWDFAVFENSFDGLFLELAFVEVSSDGSNFYRFPSTSLTDTAGIGPFAYLDPTKLNNLAGKYRANYGTPFDLQELSNYNELDINNISHVRIVDVVGSVKPEYCTRDAQGRKIADPWPTPFPGSGFDLDAVGVIHDNNPASFNPGEPTIAFNMYPQPASESITLNFSKPLAQPAHIRIFTMSGLLVETVDLPAGLSAFTKTFHTVYTSGIYRLEVESNGVPCNRLCIIN